MKHLHPLPEEWIGQRFPPGTPNEDVGEGLLLSRPTEPARLSVTKAPTRARRRCTILLPAIGTHENLKPIRDSEVSTNRPSMYARAAAALLAAWRALLLEYASGCLNKLVVV